MRNLLLMHNDKPMLIDTFVGPLRARILEYPDDDAELWRVWEVPPRESHAPSEDITERVAMDWANEVIATKGFGDGIEKAEVLAPFPAFIREIAGDKLLAQWQAEIVAALPILPNPIKRHVAA